MRRAWNDGLLGRVERAVWNLSKMSFRGARDLEGEQDDIVSDVLLSLVTAGEHDADDDTIGRHAARVLDRLRKQKIQRKAATRKEALDPTSDSALRVRPSVMRGDRDVDDGDDKPIPEEDQDDEDDDEPEAPSFVDPDERLVDYCEKHFALLTGRPWDPSILPPPPSAADLAIDRHRKEGRALYARFRSLLREAHRYALHDLTREVTDPWVDVMVSWGLRSGGDPDGFHFMLPTSDPSTVAKPPRTETAYPRARLVWLLTTRDYLGIVRDKPDESTAPTPFEMAVVSILLGNRPKAPRETKATLDAEAKLLAPPPRKPV